MSASVPVGYTSLSINFSYTTVGSHLVPSGQYKPVIVVKSAGVAGSSILISKTSPANSPLENT